MIVKKIAIVIAGLSCFLSGCASKTVREPVSALPSPVMPRYVDIRAKQKYIQNIKNAVTLYHRVILDTKKYHPKSNLQELATEADKYVNIYVKPILTDADLDSNVETKVEVAKLYLLITSLYLDIGDPRQAKEYLKMFHDRYDNDKDLLHLTINSMDIGYPTLGEGIRELEEKIPRARLF